MRDGKLVYRGGNGTFDYPQEYRLEWLVFEAHTWSAVRNSHAPRSSNRMPVIAGKDRGPESKLLVCVIDRVCRVARG